MIVQMTRARVLILDFVIASITLPIPVSYLTSAERRGWKFITIDQDGDIMTHTKRPKLDAKGWFTTVSLIDKRQVAGEFIGEINLSELADFDCSECCIQITKEMFNTIKG